MDEEQVKKLIEASLAPAIRGAFQEFRGYFQEQLEPISSRLSEFEVATQPEPTKASKSTEAPTDPALSALTARLAQMEKMEADRQQELRSYKLDNHLSSSVGKYDAIHGDLVKELLSNRYGSKVVEKEGKYYTPSGSTLDEEIEGFFKSEAGSHFLKAPVTASGNQQSSKATNTGTKAEPSLDDMLADLQF